MMSQNEWNRRKRRQIIAQNATLPEATNYEFWGGDGRLGQGDKEPLAAAEQSFRSKIISLKQ